jgi:hypothetical protein
LFRKDEVAGFWREPDTGTARRLSMEHIGIDVGSKESQICVRAADGTIIGEWRCGPSGCERSSRIAYERG